MRIKSICAASLAAVIVLGVPGWTAFAQTAPAPTEAAADKKPTETKGTKKAKKAKPSEARKAAQERQKQCGKEWREARAAGKVEKGMTWPKYYSACNKRLKEKAV
ncbi:MAG: hypothetical protein K8H87_06850 [Pseudorhodoplanes sp.]|nr:hypothetical protein [Pseudorhodoplanes sp.]